MVFASGKCWKKNGWIISVYRSTENKFNTVKIKKVKQPSHMKQ